jgi:hypothetical protein
VSRVVFVCAASVASLCARGAPPSFTDAFSPGASALWSDARGAWASQPGFYYATQPSNNPTTITLLPFGAVNFEITTTIRQVSDGGIWLRSDATGSNAVLLVTGGHQHTGRGLYWHIVQNGNYSGITNESSAQFNQGDDISVRIVVSGDTYSAYVGDEAMPATTLTTSLFGSGMVGLYDYSAFPAEAFTGFVFTDSCPADLNGDGRVDDSDFVIFVAQYNVLACSDPAMPDFCSADLNGDLAVDDSDFVIFAAAYNALLCP